ncbi:MAG: NUDIX domain-containing protein [Nitrosomonadaceae bacterium]|nr:NUDIX domain-containing protein [Nitrosomonadaceae bacterium]
MVTMEPVQPKPTPVGALVGRFQVDRLHEAHVELIQSVCNRHDKVIIVLGVSRVVGSRNNPLDVEARAQMIRAIFPDVLIVAHKDCRTDEEWSEKLDELLGTYCPVQPVTLYGGRDSFLPHYKGRYRTVELESSTVVSTSGTAIRARLSQKALNSPEFRAGAIWGAHQGWPRVVPTVDVAIFNGDFTKILLARKPGETGWCFVGGFCDPRSTSYEADAKREAIEETGLEVDDFRYICSVNVKDWRYRSEVDQIRTTLFSCRRVFGAAKANDDIAELQWFDYPIPGCGTLGQCNEIIEEHRDLMRCLHEHSFQK